MKISKKTREQAILICAIAASSPDWDEDYQLIADFVPVGDVPLELALDAWSHIIENIGESFGEVSAEAEALLQCGWLPGDDA